MRSKHTILVADDHPATLYAVSKMLTNAGFQVLQAENGEEALHLAASASACLLDVNLPDVNGVAVCQSIKAAAPKPVILMSAVYIDDVHREAGMQSGADLYITQPLDAEHIASEFDRLLA